ncbi:Gfo/Idh/MocA family protein [Arachidicoccus terrestris]|uniref:Gfo/Idh/MocA family protein n=1 Tax=Arachidicoccus terrestris TaxID=2875539 RepID=UPI001CC44D89|nr:Gfo/Idh/MocA family oxidoreductase [Arachidicoccus terrestris]UAY56192.1 Gfo/Idh/MocA family oxidoreductase [Arachidicoccus terrestris]
MDNKKLGIGILGLGEGRSAMSAALNSSLLDLRMVCDLSEDMCRLRAGEFGFHAYTTRYQELLDQPDLDIVAIYTPDHLHATHVRQALEAGKHVICTKPFIDRLEDAADLLALGEKTGLRCFVGQSSRFFEPMRQQRADYEAGKIGALMTIEAYYHADHRWFLEKPWAREDAFKWLYGGLSHPVDFIRWYLPHLETVMGYGMLSENGKAGGLHHEDTMHFIFRAKDGRVARVSGCYTGPVQPVTRDSEMSCILRGSHGCSQGDYMDLRYAITDKDGQELIQTWEHRLKHYFRFEGKSHHAGEYQNYMEYVARAILEGQPAYPDIREGIGTVAVLQAMDQSLKTGLPVRIDSLLEKYGLPAL